MKKKIVCPQPMGSWYISKILGFQSKVEKKVHKVYHRDVVDHQENFSHLFFQNTCMYRDSEGRWRLGDVFLITERDLTYSYEWYLFWSTISLDVHALNFFHIIVNQLKNRCSVCFFIFVCYSSSMTDYLEKILRIVFHSCNYGWLQKIHCQLKNGFVK